jgi:hypothetical protein
MFSPEAAVRVTGVFVNLGKNSAYRERVGVNADDLSRILRVGHTNIDHECASLRRTAMPTIAEKLR